MEELILKYIESNKSLNPQNQLFFSWLEKFFFDETLDFNQTFYKMTEYAITGGH